MRGILPREASGLEGGCWHRDSGCTLAFYCERPEASGLIELGAEGTRKNPFHLRSNNWTLNLLLGGFLLKKFLTT